MQDTTLPAGSLAAEPVVVREATSLGDLSGNQWRSGIAAWLGWLFDGLDMHLYTLVATPFVAQLLMAKPEDGNVSRTGAIIQAAFLVGWALGGGFFGLLGDRLGRCAPRADDPHLRSLDGPLLFRSDVVASPDLPFPCGTGDRRRMGSGLGALVGDLAQAVASVGCRHAAIGREHRRAHGHGADFAPVARSLFRLLLPP